MIDYRKYRCIKVEKENKLATVTLNRPEALNAVNSELHDELEHIWLDLANDEEVNAILLTGAGKAFSAGGDVKAMAARGHRGRQKVDAQDRRGGPQDHPEPAGRRAADHSRGEWRRDGARREYRAAVGRYRRL